MRISYDKAKNESNLAKHGVALSAAAGFEWQTALTWLNTREAYGEDRECGIGYIGLSLYFVVFVDRDKSRRIISLRKATRQEVHHYAEA